MKTAMQELIEEIVEHLTYDDSLSEDSRVTYETIRLRCIGKLEQEKQQIIDAFASGWNWNSDPEKYYQENYGQEEDKTFKQKSKWTEVDNMTKRLK